MMQAICLCAMLMTAQPNVQEGWASQYETRQIMSDTIEARQSFGHLPDPLPRTDGFVAVLDCSRLGDVVWLFRDGFGWEKFLVTDCAARNDGTREWMRQNNILVEVDRGTAERWGVVGRGGVHIKELLP